MHVFFADDSSHRCTRRQLDKVVAFGGILFSSEHLRALSRRIDEIADGAGIPDGEEIKWSPRRSSWIYDNLQGEDRLRCYRRILQAAIDFGGRAIVTVCEPRARNLRDEWGFERCVTYSLERVSNQLGYDGGEAIIIADRPSGGRREAEAFLEQFIDHLTSEHNHMVENTFALTLLTGPSKFLRQLQISDLVVSITAAMVAGQTLYAREYWDLVQQLLLRGNNGRIGGTGLKVYPDQLINLYHWLLGEEVYTRAALEEQIELPAARYWFNENDGT